MSARVYRPDLDGLRGVAILMVIAFHAGVSSLAGGFVGVDVFFVLSGYLITGILAREAAETGDVDLASFYARRARRLLPAFLVVLLATIGLALWLYAPIDAPGIASDARAVALHYGNVLFAQNAVNYHASSTNPLLHTWSLAVEEQFYVVWPLLFMLLGRMGGGARRMIVGVLAAGVISFVACIVVTGTSQPWAFFGMPTRIWEFAVGGLLALTLAERTTDAGPGARIPPVLLVVLGLVAIAFATLTFHEAMPYPGGRALIPVLGTAAIIAGGFLAPGNVATKLLGAPVLQWFGRISYSWYLWHWPLVGVGAVMDWKIGVIGKLAWSAVALVLAVLTLRFVEEPMRRGDAFTERPAHQLNLYALGASVAAAMIAWGALHVANGSASSPVQRRIAAARTDGMKHECWGSMTETPTAPCVFGDLSSSTNVVLMGDSHAEHWLPAMDAIGRARHWKVYAMVKPACPVADMPQLINARLKRAFTECTEWRRAMLKRIVAMHPSIVVLSSYDHYVPADGEASSWNVTPAMWGEGLRRTYAMLDAAGISTIAMRDVPDVGFDVPSCLSRRAGGKSFQLRGCSYELGESLRASAIAAQTQAARGLRHVAIVSMTDRVCSTRPCPVVQRGAIVYKDDDHLTATFSRAEARVLGERIVAAVR